MSALSAVGKLNAWQRFVIALAGAVLAYFGFAGHAAWTRSLATWNIFAFLLLALAAATITSSSSSDVRRHAQAQDVRSTLIFSFVLIAAGAAMVALAYLIHTGKSGGHLTVHLLLALATVILSWLLVHTAFSFRYAHRFYGDSANEQGTHAGGLAFPSEPRPDYRDFAYFSFVIGMTCQVSDVQVLSREMRRLALLHGILAFGFNTLILALTVNTLSGLL